MLTSDIGNLLQNPAMELDDMLDPAIAEFDARLAEAIAAAMSEKDRSRLGVSPEEIAGALHTVTQGAKYLSNARAESRHEFVARLTAAARVIFAGFGRRNPLGRQQPYTSPYDHTRVVSVEEQGARCQPTLDPKSLNT